MAAPSPPPARPAASSGSPIVKIILIVVAVFVFLGLVSAASCVYFVYRAKQKMTQIEKQAQAMQTGMPAGNTQPPAPGEAPPQVSATPIDPSTLVYPGATARQGASIAVGGLQVQEYLTDDSVDKVLSFYKEKLGPKALVRETNNQALVQIGGPTGVFSIAIGHDEASGKTKFSITRMGK
jgi:hypothetical protein